MTDADTEATPEPDLPPPTRQEYSDTIWQGDDDTSLSSSLPPMPSPLEYTPSPLVGGEFVLDNDDDASLFSTQSMQDRLHRTLQQRVVETQRSPPLGLEPTLDVARLVQQVQLLKHTNGELRHANKLLLAGGHALEAQHEGLVEARTTAELQLRESKQHASHLQHQLQQAQNELHDKQENISKLQAEIQQQVSKTKVEQQHIHQTQTKEFQEELSKLQDDNAVLLQEKRDMAHVLAETQALLQQATVECSAASHTSKRKTVGIQTNSSSLLDSGGDAVTMDVDYIKALISMTSKNTRNEKIDHDTFLPIGECLGRIRDATECTKLIQEHEAEIARLVSKHETEQKQLCAKLHEEKNALLQDAMAEMNCGYKGLRRRLESDHSEKMEQVQRQHAKELERLRNEADLAAAAAAESLQVAMAQATSAKQQCQRESKRRQALEIRLDELQAEFDEQKRVLANQHATNISKLGHGWQAERSDLVNMLQRECNSVFDRTKSCSPRSVTTDFFADIELAEKQHASQSPLSEQGDDTQMQQPSTFSELDRTLRETEAMVDRVLMGNNSD